MNGARLDRRPQRAVGLALMCAVPKFALSGEGAQLDKAIKHLLRADVPEPKFTDAGGVDEVEAGKVEQPRGGRGMHALVVHSRQPAHRR